MADMDVTAKFKADISDMQAKMNKLNGLYEDSAGKWRDASGKFASSAQKAAAGIGGLEGSTKKAGGGFTLLKGTMATAFGTALTGGITAAAGAITNFMSGTMGAASEAVQADARLKQISSSMGTLDTVLGGSTTRLTDYAQELQNLTGVSDETIKDAQSLIMTFSNVASTAGDTGGMFDRATQASLDLSAAGFGAVEGQAKALGKALQDPIKGITALSRSGVTFTNAEKDKIKALTESGQVLQAQEMIMSAVEKQVGGTAAATATGAQKMQAAFGDLQEAVGLAIFPVVDSLSKTLVPILDSLQAPLSEIATVVGGVLSQAFNALAPIIPTLATTLGEVVKTLATGLMPAVSLLLPAIAPIITALQSLAVQIAPVLATILDKVAQVFSKVLGAVTPLLAPLTNIFMGILNAAMPILDIVATMLLDLVDALTPLLDAVVTLLTPLGELIEVILAAILPVLKPIIPLFKVLADVVGVVLVKAVGLIMVALGGLILGLSKVAPFVLKNVTTPIIKFFLEMAKKVVGAAASMLGWVPGLGDKLREAETAIGKFASDTEKSMRGAADAIEKEGGRIGSEMVNTGTAALAGAAPALGASARQLGGYTANQFVDGWAARLRQAKGIPSVPLAPPVPTPQPVPTPSGTSAGASAASKQEEERMKKIEKFVSGFEAALERMKTGKNALIAATAKPFSDILGDLAPSEIESAFGIDGSIGTVISSFDQLGKAVDDFYKPLMNAKRFGKKAAADAKALHADAKSFLDTATRTALQLMKARETNKAALSKLETDYSTTVDSLNRTYDDLDKAAAANIKSIEDKWNAIIPGLENALSAATAAFDKENNVLQSLIQARDGFLGRINEGFRGFLNNLTINKKQIVKEVENAIPVVEMRRTIKDMGNGIRVTIEEQIKPAMEELADSISEQPLSGSDIKSALDERLAEIRAFAANIRTLTARGVDASLIQEFVSAGVQGAGEIASALAVASDAEIAGVNAAQSELATEIAGFQTFAAQQWFNAGIAQQEAIVAPLAAARDQAQAALNTANATRTAELAAAQAHAEALKVQRQQALDAAKAQYETQKNALIKQGEDIDLALTTNATNLHNSIANLQNTVPPEMMKAGKKSVTQMLAGFNEKFPGMKSALNQKMDNLAASMNRTATVTVTTVQRTIFDNGAGPDGKRALGGPVLSGKTYLVGERGPELLTMGAYSGTVIPNDKIGTVPMMGGRGGGGNTTIVNINVQTGIATDPAETGRQVVEAIRKYERRSGAVFASA